MPVSSPDRNQVADYLSALPPLPAPDVTAGFPWLERERETAAARRRLQFPLRYLLLAVSGVCVVMSVWFSQWWALVAIGGRPGYDDTGSVIKVDMLYSLSDFEATFLSRLKRLEELDLSESEVSNSGLKHLSALERLKVLNLSGRDLSVSGLAHVGILNGLQDLDLKDTQVTDLELVHLGGLIGLRRLNLNRASVTDAGLPRLMNLKHLQDLDLTWTLVSDGALGDLGQLTNLRCLNLSGTAVTEAGLQRLEKSLPNCKIVCEDIGPRPPANSQLSFP